MTKTIKEEKEFIDEGLVYIKVFYTDGSTLVKQKEGVTYPIPPKTKEELEKLAYSNLSTDKEKIEFLAKKARLV